MHHRRDPVEALRRILRVLLGAPRPVPLDLWAVPIDELVRVAERHRLVVFLDDRLPRGAVPPELHEQFSLRARRERIACLGLARELGLVQRRLKAEGVDLIAFKGLVLASQVYGNFASRGSGDLDVLVPEHSLEVAWHALIDDGWVADASHPRPGPTWAWRHLVRNYHEVPLHRNGVTVDLHWRLSAASSRLPDFDDLWSRRETFTLGGAAVATMSRSDALVHSAMHAAKHDWSLLRSLVDVNLLLKAEGRLPRIVPRSAQLTARVVDEQLDRGLVRSKATKRAIATQSDNSDGSTGRFPGHLTLVTARKFGRDVTTAEDLKRVLATTLVPPSAIAGIDAQSGLAAAADLTLQRFGTLRRRFREWRPRAPRQR